MEQIKTQKMLRYEYFTAASAFSIAVTQVYLKTKSSKMGYKKYGKENMSSALWALSMYKSLNGSGLLVPCPCSVIHAKFCTSHLCMKMLYFLYVFACAMPCILYLLCGILFPVGTLITFSDKHQLWCGCQGETSSEKISDNIIEGGKGPKKLGCLYFQGRESL